MPPKPNLAWAPSTWNAAHTAEMSWSKRFETLYAAKRAPGASLGTRIKRMNSPGWRTLLRYPV